MLLCLFGVVPGGRDAADGQVFVADASYIGAGGQVPSPRSRARHVKDFYVYIGWFQGLRMLPTATFLSLTPAMSAVEVRELHPEVGLGMLINLIYNMSM